MAETELLNARDLVRKIGEVKKEVSRYIDIVRQLLVLHRTKKLLLRSLLDTYKKTSQTRLEMETERKNQWAREKFAQLQKDYKAFESRMASLVNDCTKIIAEQRKAIRLERTGIEHISDEWKSILSEDARQSATIDHSIILEAYNAQAAKNQDLFQKMRGQDEILWCQEAILNNPYGYMSNQVLVRWLQHFLRSEKNYSSAVEALIRLFDIEKVFLRDELGILRKEEKAAEVAEEKAAAEDIDKFIANFTKQSWVVVYSNSARLNIVQGFRFAEGMHLRRVSWTQIKDEKEWSKWEQALGAANSQYMKGRAAYFWYEGDLPSQNAHFNTVSFPDGTDHVGRPAITSVSIIYPKDRQHDVLPLFQNEAYRMKLLKKLREFARI
jgi:hypothetical protein